MGQRSQIYIRIKDNYNKLPKLYAKYFGWNFGERMISRARHGIEYILEYNTKLESDYTKEKINRMFEVNFDMKDIVISSDIIKEWIEQFSDCYKANDYIFKLCDNNDGKLFIDVDKNGEIKFCFTDYDLNILSPEEYMNWDYENWRTSEYLEKKDVAICEENIKFINEKAKAMTKEELEEFINFDYSKQIEELAKNLNLEIKAIEEPQENILSIEQNQDEIDICE